MVRMIVTATCEYDANPEHYDSGSTAKDMALTDEEIFIDDIGNFIHLISDANSLIAFSVRPIDTEDKEIEYIPEPGITAQQIG